MRGRHRYGPLTSSHRPRGPGRGRPVLPPRDVLDTPTQYPTGRRRLILQSRPAPRPTAPPAPPHPHPPPPLPLPPPPKPLPPPPPPGPLPSRPQPPISTISPRAPPPRTLSPPSHRSHPPPTPLHARSSPRASINPPPGHHPGPRGCGRPARQGDLPGLLWHFDEAGWNVLGYEYAPGRHAEYSPGSPDLDRLVQLMDALSANQSQGRSGAVQAGRRDRGSPISMTGDGTQYSPDRYSPTRTGPRTTCWYRGTALG